MRKIHILFCLSFFLIFGCLEDEGNYDYDDIKEPKWHTDQPISVYATEHNVMNCADMMLLDGIRILFRGSGKYAMSGS